MTIQGRYELKFPVETAEKDRFLSAVREELEPDPHCVDSAYRVSSLYFDSADLRAYWEKLDGEEIRSKYRLRFYSRESSEQIDLESATFEIKHRVNNTVYKERAKLTAAGAEALLSGRRTVAEVRDCVDPQVNGSPATLLKIIHAATAQGGLHPTNIITYIREAWIGRQNPRLRVTFDRLVEAYSPGDHLRVATRSGQLALPSTRQILEIKFDHAIPRFLRDVVCAQGITLRRFSKYAAGVEAPGVVPRVSDAPRRADGILPPSLSRVPSFEDQVVTS